MEERVKDFIGELAGIIRDTNKPDYEALLDKWETYFRRMEINTADKQLQELHGILRAHLLSDSISLVPPELPL